MSKIRKAITAAITAGLAAVGQAVATDGLGHVNWVVVAGAVLVAGLAVFRIPNASKA